MVDLQALFHLIDQLTEAELDQLQLYLNARRESLWHYDYNQQQEQQNAPNSDDLFADYSPF